VVTVGTGTFGRVFLAKFAEPQPNRPEFFALKILSKAECVRLRQVEHVNSEREILAVVKHPFIVDMFLTFQTPSNLFMCLEYMVGGELFSHLRKHNRFSPDVARFYAACIVLALEYLHENDIIYRDLKPEVATPNNSTDVEFIAGSPRIYQNYRFRVLKTLSGSDLDCVRYTRISCPGNHPFGRPRKSSRLVGSRHSNLRDARRIPSLLRLLPARNIRENPRGEFNVPVLHGLHCKGLDQTTPPSGLILPTRQSEGRGA
jgi:Protein kinase domain